MASKGKSMYPAMDLTDKPLLASITKALLNTAKEDDLDSMREIITTDMNITKMIGSKFERKTTILKTI